MRAKLIEKERPKPMFKSFKVEIEITSLQELKDLWAIFNASPASRDKWLQENAAFYDKDQKGIMTDTLPIWNVLNDKLEELK